MKGARVLKILLVISSKLDDVLDFRKCLIHFFLASVIRIIFMLEKFPGTESFRIKILSSFCIY